MRVPGRIDIAKSSLDLVERASESPWIPVRSMLPAEGSPTERLGESRGGSSILCPELLEVGLDQLMLTTGRAGTSVVESTKVLLIASELDLSGIFV